MEVKFLKYCPWSYRLTRGNLTKHREGTTAQVTDIEANAMIDAGYAEQVKPGRKPTVKPKETKVFKPAEIKLNVMTKKELEILGRKHGVELDRRKTRASLVEQIKGILGGSK